jgi:hypothetical protein
MRNHTFTVFEKAQLKGRCIMQAVFFDTNSLNELIYHSLEITKFLERLSFKIVVPEFAYIEMACNADLEEAADRLIKLGRILAKGDRIYTHVARNWQSIIARELIRGKKSKSLHVVSPKTYNVMVGNLLRAELWLTGNSAGAGRVQVQQSKREMLQTDKSARQYVVDKGISISDEYVDRMICGYMGIDTTSELCLGFPEFLYRSIVNDLGFPQVLFPSFKDLVLSAPDEYLVTKTWINLCTLHVFGTLYSESKSSIFKPAKSDWMDTKIVSIAPSGDFFVTGDEKLAKRFSLMKDRSMHSTVVINFDQFFEMLGGKQNIQG